MVGRRRGYDQVEMSRRLREVGREEHGEGRLAFDGFHLVAVSLWNGIGASRLAFDRFHLVAVSLHRDRSEPTRF